MTSIEELLLEVSTSNLRSKEQLERILLSVREFYLSRKGPRSREAEARQELLGAALFPPLRKPE